MKKAVITLSVLAALASASSYAATVYDQDGTTLNVGGRAEARFNVSDDNKDDSNSQFEDKSRARINLVGKSMLDQQQGLYAFGKYEAELTSDDSDSDGDNITNRYIYAGLGTHFGEFSYGKQDSSQVMISNFTDVMSTFGGAAADVVAGNKDKRDNNFLYKGQFDALTVETNYIASDAKDDNSYGVAAKYQGAQFAIGAGYVIQDTTDGTDDQFNLGGQFQVDIVTLGALYTRGDVGDATYDGIELSAIVKATDKLSLVGVYNKGDYDSGLADQADNIAIEAVYKFNPHVKTYAGYLFQQLDNKNDQLQAGISYEF